MTEESITESVEPQQAEGTEIQTEQTESTKEEGGLDWSKVDEKFANSYKNVQGAFTKSQQELKSLKPEYDTIKQQLESSRDKIDLYDRLDAILTADPNKAAQFQTILGIQQNNQPNIDPTLLDDPAVKFAHEQTQTLSERLAKIEQSLNSFQETDKRRQVNSRVDREMSAAKNTYKQLFGNEPTDEIVNNILKTMEKSKVYDASLVTKAMFAEKFAEHKAQKVLDEQKAKRDMFARPTLMNSSTARENAKEDITLKEAYEEALREANSLI